MIRGDHAQPDLIWNQQTRRELRVALEDEISAFHAAQVASGQGNVAWNHRQFRVAYPSLAGEPRVGTVYLNLFLDASDEFIAAVSKRSRGLFESLYRKVLSLALADEAQATLCVRCMTRLYLVVGAKGVGPFEDVETVCTLMLLEGGRDPKSVVGVRDDAGILGR